MEESTDELLYSLSKVKLPQWLGLKVSVYMCLRYNYVLSLIHAAPHVTSGLEVNIQGVLCSTHNGGPFKSQRRTEMQEKNILSDMRPPSSPSFPLISPSSAGCTDSAHILRQFQHPLSASRTNPLCLHPRMSTSMLGLALGMWNYEKSLNCSKK